MFGLLWVRTGFPAVTVKELARATTSLFEVSVTLRVPVAAAGSILMTAIAIVGDATVTETTATPDPKVAVVMPCAKCVNWPEIVTDKLC